MNELLSVKRVQSFSQIGEEEVGELVNKVSLLSGQNGGCVNLSEVISSTSNDIVCKCLFGDKIYSERFGELAWKVMMDLAAFSVGDYFPYLGWVDVLTGLIPRMKAHFKELDELFDQVIQDHKDKLALLYKGGTTSDHDDQFSNSTKSLLDGILQLQQDGRLHYDFTQDDIKSILIVNFLSLFFKEFILVYLYLLCFTIYYINTNNLYLESIRRFNFTMSVIKLSQ